MFGWIPILGPIIDGIVSIVNKFQDKDIAAVQLEQTKVQASTEIIKATEDDLGVRLCRDILLFPVVIWTGLIVWDKIIEIRYPDLVWGVMPLTGVVAYLPYAAFTFLLGWSFKRG